MIKKIVIKIMRMIAVFRISRIVALGIVKLLPRNKIKRVDNKDVSLNVDKVFKEIEMNGHSNVFAINEERLNKIIEYSNTIEYKNLQGNESFKINYDDPKRPSESLWYANYNIIESNVIKELVYDSKILEIAKKYLGAEPIVKDVRMWWSFPPKNKNYNELYGFHYDIDALKFLKLFVYITDVGQDSGPHVIISKTHKSKSFFEKKNRRLTDEQVSQNYKKGSVNTIIGAKGSAFFEDTFCYHKGTIPEKPRFILQFEYAI